MQLKSGTPEEAGMRPEVVDRIRQRAESWVAEGRNPAMVLLAARRGVIFFHQAFGKLGPEPEAPSLPIDALFPLASLTKPITATAVMILVEEGKLGLNRPVQEYIPEFQGEGKEKVMVHHLLTHTSGVEDDQVLDWLENEPDKFEVPEPEATQTARIKKVLTFTYQGQLHFEPGAKMVYSSLGIFIAAEIVRRISGQSFDQIMRERIFDPLGMNDSFLIVPERLQDRVIRRLANAPGAEYQEQEWMEHPSPSGGGYSTALDMAKFGQMFLNRGAYWDQRILSPATVNAMTRNQIPGVSASMLEWVFPEASWGLGWSVGHPFKGRVYGEALPHRYFNHGGYGGVEMWIDSKREIVGVYFSIALEVDEADFTRHNADLFMNMVTAEATELRSEHLQPRAEPHVLESGTPSIAGVSSERLERVIEQASNWVDEGIHPSLVMLAARRGVIFLNQSFGKFGPEADAPDLTMDAIFPIASISKPITATAAMILVEEGLLGLNRSVAEYIPEFAGEGADKVLVRNLLTHTSGLQDEALDEHAQHRAGDSHAPDINNPEPLHEYFSLRFDAPIKAPVNHEMVYATFNYDLLGEIVVRVSGMPLADFAHQRIFGPLGMRNTSFDPSDELAARLIRRPETAPYSQELGNWVRTTLGSAGAVSSANDMVIFGQMFLNRGTYDEVRILSPASVAAMTRNQIPGIPASFRGATFPEGEWGLGWSIHHTKKSWGYDEPLLSQEAYCHGGSGGVFLWLDPAHDLVAVFFSVYLSLTENERPVASTDLFINSILAAITDP